MSVRVEGRTIRLEGECHVEQAETLAGLLESGAADHVDISRCRLAHAAVVQVLLAFDAEVVGAAEDVFLMDFVAPNLRRESADIKDDRSNIAPPV